MSGLRYLDDVVTLSYDPAKCTGCQQCALVCPHGVFAMEGNRAVLRDRDACIECGACALNCEFGAIGVRPGVGCAAGVIQGWFRRSEPGCGGTGDEASPGAGCSC
ncbi:MAG TPA: mercury methylation ferredoxin HgcB [Coriobacteriia bacterium]